MSCRKASATASTPPRSSTSTATASTASSRWKASRTPSGLRSRPPQLELARPGLAPLHPGVTKNEPGELISTSGPRPAGEDDQPWKPPAGYSVQRASAAAGSRPARASAGPAGSAPPPRARPVERGSGRLGASLARYQVVVGRGQPAQRAEVAFAPGGQVGGEPEDAAPQ